MPTEIKILGKVFPMYGLLCTLGIIIAILVALFLARRKKIDSFDLCLNVLFCLIGAFVGSKLLYAITSFSTVVTVFQTYPFFKALEVFASGGYVFYGGLIGGVVALLISLKVQKKNFFEYLNIFATVLPLGHAIGRIGCFVSGCCYGMEYNGFLSYTYTIATDPNTPIGVPLFPVQLVEAALLVVLFAVLLLLHLKSKSNSLTTFVYCYSYAVIRFVLEFFRGDKVRGIYLLSTSQWVSIGAIILCTVILIILKTKKTKQNS